MKSLSKAAPAVNDEVFEISHLVPGFNRVRIARDFPPCPKCRKKFGPHAMRNGGVEIGLRCQACGRDALTCTLREDV
jgi:hypothetical protein